MPPIEATCAGVGATSAGSDPDRGCGERQARVAHAQQRQRFSRRGDEHRERDHRGKCHAAHQRDLARNCDALAAAHQPVGEQPADPAAGHRHERRQDSEHAQLEQVEVPGVHQVGRKPRDEEVDDVVQAEEPKHHAEHGAVTKQVSVAHVGGVTLLFSASFSSTRAPPSSMYVISSGDTSGASRGRR
jgi:hypothetical protein